MKALASRAAARAPLCLFLAALMLTAFGAGVVVHRDKVFPYDLLVGAKNTALRLYNVFFRERLHRPFVTRGLQFVDLAPESAEARRFEFIGAAGFSGPIQLSGVAGAFADHCPGFAGCLAVEYGPRGDLLHAWPYRPEEFDKEEPIVRFVRQTALPWLSFEDKARSVHTRRYPNGDLLAVFQFRNAFPYGGGVARIDPAGRPVWYREDFSHHAPYLTADGAALVPSMRIRRGQLVIKHGGAELRGACRRSILADFVHVIAGDGRLLEEISVLDALLESPYASILIESSCYPTHLNYVHQVREDAAGADGIAPGDLVLSLRNLSAFGILDRASHRLKKLVRGGFLLQHSVTHLEGSRFLMFDNWGRKDGHGPSRLLMVDLADGRETTIFPNDETPAHLRGFFSYIGGHISVSPDRRRAIMTFLTPYTASRAVEIRLADGAVLAILNPLHDLSRLERFPEKRKTRAARYRLTTVNYVGGANGG